MPDIAELVFRIEDILRDPRESLDVELKGWLDLETREHQALLAKALLAMANHGGGVVIIGLRQEGAIVEEAPGRPDALGRFNADIINGVVARYAEPAFHCDVRISRNPAGQEYPVVLIPGGHRAPIRSTRDGPEQNHIRRNIYYIRRPGPQSDAPQTGGEWNDLLRRCLANSREDLLDSFRQILAGGGASPVAPQGPAEHLREWFEASLGRWNELVGAIGDGPQAFPHGYYATAYRIRGDIQEPTLPQFLEVLRGYPRHTGWPPFWVPNRQGIEPYIADGNIECWLGREAAERDPAHSDFWRASPSGSFFLIRGYQEDGLEGRQAGTAFDLTLPSWRIGEILLHAKAMAEAMGDPSAEIDFTVRWTGLRGRELATIGNPNRWLFDGHRAQDQSYEATISVPADRIQENLPEFVSQIVTPLYARFGFFVLPANLVTEELARMREGRF